MAAGEKRVPACTGPAMVTVATFSPTDVDQRIRVHAWSHLEGKRLAAAVERVEEITRWDPRPVSARRRSPAPSTRRRATNWRR